MTCPFRNEAYRYLRRLSCNHLEDTKVFNCLAKEFDKDLFKGISELNLALDNIRGVMQGLMCAGRSRPLRRQAIKNIINWG